MIVQPSEFVSARDASRRLGHLVDRLERNELAKAVIVDRNKPRAVVLSIDVYEAMMLWVPLHNTETQGTARRPEATT